MKATQKWSKILQVGMISVVLTFGLALMGCVTPGAISHSTINSTEGVIDVNKMALFNGDFGYTLSAESRTLKENTSRYFSINYSHGEWAFIESLAIKIDDGEYLSLSKANGSRDVQSGGHVTEWVLLRVLDSDLEKIRTSNKWTCQIRGSKRDSSIFVIEGELLEKLKEFWQ